MLYGYKRHLINNYCYCREIREGVKIFNMEEIYLDTFKSCDYLVILYRYVLC